mgnify:CR=1 FL=1
MSERGAMRIMVVEDDPDALKTIEELLEALGHWTAGVTSAELALNRYIEGAFDVLLTDVGLPALSGRDLADLLSARAKIPVIFATGQPQPADLPEHTIWLRKPFMLEQVAKALESAAAMHCPERADVAQLISEPFRKGGAGNAPPAVPMALTRAGTPRIESR